MESAKPHTASPWLILVASFGILFVTSGSRFSFGVMFKPMIAEFGWDRSALSLAFFLNMSVFAFSLTVVGRLYDQFGPRWVITLSSLFFSAGLIAVCFIQSLWQFYLCYGIVSALGLGGLSVPLMGAITSKWFHTWRGLAISIAMSGSCLGQFALIPLFSFLTMHYGWRLSYLYMGLMALVINVALALFVMKPDPGPVAAPGRSPDLNGERASQEVAHETPSKKAARDATLFEAMRTRSFWLYLIVMFVCGSGDFLVTTHLIPCATDYGIPAATAGNMLAWLGLLSLAGILLAGPASDLFGNKVPVILTFALRFFLFIFILNYHSTVSFYIFSLAFGFTLLITAPITTTLMGRLYGFTHVGLISGFITTVHHLGGGFWAYMGGLFYDKTGSYGMAFRLSALMALVATFSALLMTEKRGRMGVPEGRGSIPGR